MNNTPQPSTADESLKLTSLVQDRISTTAGPQADFHKNVLRETRATAYARLTLLSPTARTLFDRIVYDRYAYHRGEVSRLRIGASPPATAGCIPTMIYTRIVAFLGAKVRSLWAGSHAVAYISMCMDGSTQKRRQRGLHDLWCCGSL